MSDSGLSGRDDVIARILAAEELERRLRYSGLERFAPSVRQREFCDASAGYSEVLLTGGRQTTGKTYTLTGWVAMNLTGLYPAWYRGRRWDRPVVMAGGTVTARQTRDVFAKYLLGDEHDRGSGWIPRHCFEDLGRDIVRLTGGVMGQIDKFRCKHFTNGVFDGWSQFIIFSYQSGRENLQGYTLDAACLDEEPDYEIKHEMSARMDATATGGVLMMTFSTLQGYSQVVEEFVRDGAEAAGKKWIPMAIQEAGHLSEEVRERKIAKYRGHFLEAPELAGVPNRGDGLIYRVPDEEIIVEHVEPYVDWRWICGIDVPHTAGYFAAVLLVYDPMTDIVYLVREFKARDRSRLECEGVLRQWKCARIPVAWPHDAARAMAHGADEYRQAGLNMLAEPAHFLLDDGAKSMSVLAAIAELNDRMISGRFKVLKNCAQWLKEKQAYMHEDGSPAKNQDDHLLDATNKAMMMLRFAAVQDREVRKRGRTYGKADFFGA